MLLGHEEGVKVPEAGVDVTVRNQYTSSINAGKYLLSCGHLHEALREEDVPELLPDLVQRMQRTSVLVGTQRSEIIRLEIRSLPCAALKKFRSQISMFDRDFLRVLGTLLNGIGNNLCDSNKLLLLQLREEFSVRECVRLLDTSVSAVER